MKLDFHVKCLSNFIGSLRKIKMLQSQLCYCNGDSTNLIVHMEMNRSIKCFSDRNSAFIVFVGPVHVHNPGTVIVSLLNHFTGQVGPTIEAVKTVVRRCSEEEDGRDEEEDRRDCPVFHPTSPTSIHLSEEERSAEINTMFIPSQEQGKDCHVSKEEVL